MFLLAVVLTLSPWKGAALPTATANGVQYLLAVHGKPQQRVSLDASHVPKGWIASFCTENICSPFHYAMQLDSNGRGQVEFQAVRIDDAAPRHIRVTIASNDGHSIDTDVAARTSTSP